MKIEIGGRYVWGCSEEGCGTLVATDTVRGLEALVATHVAIAHDRSEP